MSQPAKKPSQASRYLFLLLVGLVIGVVAAVMGLRAWQERQDPFPHSVMHVMDHHADALKQSIAANRCAASDTVPHLRTLRAMADDIETAFPDLAQDARFGAHATDLRRKLDAALENPPANCAAASAALAQVHDSCSACHQDFND